MFFDDYLKTNDRPRSALEVAMQARSKEKARALVVADYQADHTARSSSTAKRGKGLLSSLLSLFS